VGITYVPTTAISLDELDAMGNLTIPRAVGYAAGMINFFFRGQLMLSSPPDGLYGVLDQATAHSVSADGIPVVSGGAVFGFKTIRVRVRNLTPDLAESGSGRVVPQTMKGGKLVAIARYHRNPCYQPNLSGEYTTMINKDGTTVNGVPSGCGNGRTEWQEISVSAPVQLDSNGNLPGTSAVIDPNQVSACANVGNINTGAVGVDPACVNSSALMEFDFSNDPIPVNATDLFLQVAYRGQLGEESDGIAVGTVDLQEPNYDVFVNNSDWSYSGTWTQIPVAQQLQETDGLVCFNSQAIATNITRNPGEFNWLVTLTDQPYVLVGEMSQFNGEPTLLGTDVQMIPRQSDMENGGTFVNYVHNTRFNIDQGMHYLRGVTTGSDWHITTFNVGPAQTLQDYGQIENLTPDIGGDKGPDVPIPTQLQFTSAADPTCQQNFPGPYPGISSQPLTKYANSLIRRPATSNLMMSPQ